MNEHIIPSPSPIAAGVQPIANQPPTNRDHADDRRKRPGPGGSQAHIEEHAPPVGSPYARTSLPQHADWDEV